MTRINLVPPELLTNQHLLAEYKEITRIPTAVRKLVNVIRETELPKEYCLGAGHCKFFYDKLLFCFTRYRALYYELLARGYNLDQGKFVKICADWQRDFANTVYWNDYFPSPEEVYLNMARLAKRSKIDKVIEELSS